MNMCSITEVKGYHEMDDHVVLLKIEFGPIVILGQSTADGDVSALMAIHRVEISEELNIAPLMFGKLYDSVCQTIGG